MLKIGILDVEGTKYTLKMGREYILGRKSTELSHDIEIDHQSVDIKHSIIDLTQHSSPQLFDVCSKHGTFVDDMKIERFKSIPLAKTSRIRFGNVETCLQFLFEGDSGFLEERLNSPDEDTSEIISNSPERISSSGSRLKNSLKNSITSTPNQSTNSSLPSESKLNHNFLVPLALPRTSIGSNNSSARSCDSFFIPETQHFPDGENRKSNNSTNKSPFTNISKKNTIIGDCADLDNDDDDFFIPETQEVISAPIALPNHPRLAFPNGDVNENLSQDDKIPSSQFRLCTQDFNGSDDDLSNQSGDILANVPLSLVIPAIKHDAVLLNDFQKNDEDEIENEMSALQWSKKTLEDQADGSVTPDGLFDVVGSVTSDLGKRISVEKSPSQRSTPDIFANPEEAEVINKNRVIIISQQNKPAFKETNNNNGKIEQTNDSNTSPIDLETEYAPTQTFIKPIPVENPFIRPTSPLSSSDDYESLPETQVFEPPVMPPKPIANQSLSRSANLTHNEASNKKSLNKSLNSSRSHVFAMPSASPKHKASPKTLPSPKPKSQPSPKVQKQQISTPIDDDDLPPTQVFNKDEHVQPPGLKTNIFSSTLLDCEQQLSENSFKAKFNKLLDSDDDEMDELLAPDLVKQTRQNQTNPQVLKSIPESPKTPQNKTVKPSNQKENTASEQTTPVNKFKLPDQVAKANNSKVPAVSIENFLLTPDFLGKELSKNTQVQREAELNWKNIMLAKTNQELFGNEHNDNDSDASEDSFVDLLPKRRETRSKSINKAPSDKPPKLDKKEDVVPPTRVTRRKSTSARTVSNEEKGNSKKDTKTEIVKNDRISNDGEKREESKKDKSTKEERVSSQETSRRKEKEKKEKEEKIKKEKEEKIKKEKELKVEKNKKSSKAEKNSIINQFLGENSSLSKSSSLNDDSSNTTEEKPSKKSNPTKKSNKTPKDSSAIKESIETKTRLTPKEPESSASARISSSTSSNTPQEQIDATEQIVSGGKTRLRSRRKVEEPSSKVEEKPSKPRAAKRSAAEGRSSSKSSKITKLDGIKLDNKQSDSVPSPRITRLKSSSDLKKDSSNLEKPQKDSDNEKARSKSTEKAKEERKKPEPKKKTKPSGRVITLNEEAIDLTESDAEVTIEPKKTARKRKSQEDIPSNNCKYDISTSQNSSCSADSNRSLRNKKKIKIAITSCSKQIRETLLEYSGKVWDYTEDPKECDILLLEAGNRTYKLLVAIARGVPVVRIDWLKEVIVMRSTDVPPERYIFEDENFQTRHKFVMRESIQLARTKSLFGGMNFMMTPNITPKPDEMKDIITCAGGKILADIPKAQDNIKFYLVSENIDNQLWYQYRRASREVKVITAIGLMASVMQQSLEPLMKSIR